jgi:hypothetical protein
MPKSGIAVPLILEESWTADMDRRSGEDRRKTTDPNYNGPERRSNIERRSGIQRRRYRRWAVEDSGRQK